MNFTCVLCNKEYMFFSNLCNRCIIIRNIIKIYGKNRVIDILENKLIVKKKLKEDIKDITNKLKDINLNS